MPPETLLPTTVRWIETLPSDVQPAAVARALPSIANTLAELWNFGRNRRHCRVTWARCSPTSEEADEGCLFGSRENCKR